jgi:hypothetical protein
MCVHLWYLNADHQGALWLASCPACDARPSCMQKHSSMCRWCSQANNCCWFRPSHRYCLVLLSDPLQHRRHHAQDDMGQPVCTHQCMSAACWGTPCQTALHRRCPGCLQGTSRSGWSWTPSWLVWCHSGCWCAGPGPAGNSSVSQRCPSSQAGYLSAGSLTAAAAEAGLMASWPMPLAKTR